MQSCLSLRSNLSGHRDEEVSVAVIGMNLIVIITGDEINHRVTREINIVHKGIKEGEIELKHHRESLSATITRKNLEIHTTDQTEVKNQVHRITINNREAVGEAEEIVEAGEAIIRTINFDSLELIWQNLQCINF